MRLVTPLILLTLFSACGLHIDPAFSTYVTQWNDYYPDHSVDVTIEFGDMSVCGDCVGYFDGAEIEIDQDFWGELDNGGRQQLVFHELGHAMFNYGHDWYCIDTQGSDIVECQLDYLTGASPSDYIYIPRSIMFPYTFYNDQFYTPQEAQNYYIPQLYDCTTCTSSLNGTGDEFTKLQRNNGIMRRID